jgi:cytochrome b561
MSLSDNSSRYGLLTRVFHWGMAAVLIWQFTSVFAHVFFEDTAVDRFLWATHKPTGLLLFGLIVLRLLWALYNRSRRPASISLAATLGHVALYALLLTVPSFALLRQYGSGRTFEAFGLTIFEGFSSAKIEWMLNLGNNFHGVLGWLLMVLTAGHIVMVIWHKCSKNSVDVLPRMWR